MGTGYKCVRATFMVINALFWVMGVGILSLGIWIYLNGGQYVLMLQEISAFIPACLMIASGSLVIILGFVGCCSICTANRCMLIVYFLVVVIIFILEVTAGVVAFINRQEVAIRVKNDLFDKQKEYQPLSDEPNRDEIITLWDNVQSNLHCCGVETYTDWYHSAAWPGYEWVPDSCCIHRQKHCGKSSNRQNYYKEGCYNTLVTLVTEHLHLAGLIGLILGFLQLSALVASTIMFCYLNKEIKKMKRIY